MNKKVRLKSSVSFSVLYDRKGFSLIKYTLENPDEDGEVLVEGAFFNIWLPANLLEYIYGEEKDD